MTVPHTERVRAELERRIASGELPPGSALDEGLISEIFAVSRTPVREALLQLAATGFVRIVSRSGIFVSQLSLDELTELFETLALTDGACAQLAACRISSAQIETLQHLQRDGERAVAQRDLDAYTVYNTALHSCIYTAARNSFLVDQIQHLRKRTNAYRHRQFDRSNRMEQSWMEHQSLCEALYRADGSTAMQRAAEHVLSGSRDFSSLANTQPEQFIFDTDSRSAWDDDRRLLNRPIFAN